jgi:hypothetical protein
VAEPARGGGGPDRYRRKTAEEYPDLCYWVFLRDTKAVMGGQVFGHLIPVNR